MFKSKDVKRLEGQKEELGIKIDQLTGKVAELESALKSAQTKVKEANELLRDQSEADLLINALKALKIIPDKNKIGDFTPRDLAYYQSQAANISNQRQAAMQVIPNYGGGLGSIR